MNNYQRLGIIAFITLILVVLFVRIRSARFQSNLLEANPVSSNNRATVQQKRIENSIEEANTSSIEYLISTLHEPSVSSDIAVLGGLEPGGFGVSVIKMILTDRRVLKLFEHLNALDSNEACRIAADLFDEKHGLYKQWLLSDAPHVAGEDGISPVTKAQAARHSIWAALFLCSYFCPPEILDEKLQAFDSFESSPAMRQMRSNDTYRVENSLDRLFRLNLMVISGWRNGADMEAVRDIERQAKRLFSLEELELPVQFFNVHKWSARTVEGDFTHLSKGVPVDTSTVMAKVPLIGDENASFFLTSQKVNQERFEELVNILRDWRDDDGID
ncbi:MAG: hypothetical protein KatS3mg111_3457 [Pirellulaceae bacterium]|nr:MAG: hypothetical protein KatS3mg111_3457 [Pirellulaceae bacterium]